jgi:hypothetical protein
MKIARARTNLFIRAAFVLFMILLAIYIPLKIYIARSENADDASREPVLFSIFVTNELNGYREPCG